MNPVTIISAISLALNVALGLACLQLRDAAVAAKTQASQAQGVSKACSEATDNLSKQAAKRHTEAKPKVEAATQVADASNKQADQILSTPPAVAGDDCKSAQVRVDSWWATK